MSRTADWCCSTRHVINTWLNKTHVDSIMMFEQGSERKGKSIIQIDFLLCTRIEKQQSVHTKAERQGKRAREKTRWFTEKKRNMTSCNVYGDMLIVKKKNFDFLYVYRWWNEPHWSFIGLGAFLDRTDLSSRHYSRDAKDRHIEREREEQTPAHIHAHYSFNQGNASTISFRRSP